MSVLQRDETLVTSAAQTLRAPNSAYTEGHRGLGFRVNIPTKRSATSSDAPGDGSAGVPETWHSSTS